MNRSELRDILRKRYPTKEYALMEEVRDKAGFDASRSADFMVMNLWPSRGLHLEGIELKSYRSDWLSELKKPEKAEAIFQHCDFFWLLTENDTVAKLDEIPTNWGWLLVKNGKIFVQKEAPKLEPRPLPRSFLAALLKRATDKTGWTHDDDLKERFERIKQASEERVAQRTSRQLEEYAKLKDRVKQFETSSGLDFGDWDFKYGRLDATKIGETVKFLQAGGADQVRKDLLNLQSKAQDILINLTKQLHNLHEQQEPTNGTPGNVG